MEHFSQKPFTIPYPKHLTHPYSRSESFHVTHLAPLAHTHTPQENQGVGLAQIVPPPNFFLVCEGFSMVMSRG